MVSLHKIIHHETLTAYRRSSIRGNLFPDSGFKLQTIFSACPGIQSSTGIHADRNWHALRQRGALDSGFRTSATISGAIRLGRRSIWRSGKGCRAAIRRHLGRSARVDSPDRRPGAGSTGRDRRLACRSHCAHRRRGACYRHTWRNHHAWSHTGAGTARHDPGPQRGAYPHNPTHA